MFVFNFHPTESYVGLHMSRLLRDYRVVLNTDSPQFEGQGRVPEFAIYPRQDVPMSWGSGQSVQLYLPSRTAGAAASVKWGCRNAKSRTGEDRVRNGIVVMRPGQLFPNELEIALIKAMMAENPALRIEIDKLHVLSRKYAGVGCFTDFSGQVKSPVGAREMRLSVTISIPTVWNAG